MLVHLSNQMHHVYKSRFLGISILLTVLFLAQSAYAREAPKFPKQDFDKAKFDQLQKEGKPVLIDVYASWCPTCERQQWLLSSYFKENPDSNVLVMVVDYDEDKQWVKHFKAPRQSTLALYQNGERVWFSVAETRKRYIVAALEAVQ